MASQLLDVSQWLVTDENPLRDTDGLDYERCAALHNHIVERGWLGSGRSLDEMERRSWFDFHGDAAAEAREKMTPNLIKFLERAYIVPHGLRFFYWVEGLSMPEDPDELWQNHDPDLVEDGGEFDTLTLYPVNENLAEHGDGLM